MNDLTRLAWCVCLIVAGTVGALFLPLVVCIGCDVGAGVFAFIGPERPPCP